MKMNQRVLSITTRLAIRDKYCYKKHQGELI